MLAHLPSGCQPSEFVITAEERQLLLRRCPIPILLLGIRIDGDDIVARAGINGGIERTKSADIALARGIGVDEEAVVAAA